MLGKRYSMSWSMNKIVNVGIYMKVGMSGFSRKLALEYGG